MTYQIMALGDLHLRDDVPACRTDKYFEAQERKVRWLVETHREAYAPVVIAPGDLFDYWKPSPFLLQWAIRELRPLAPIWAVPGNHDLPQHNLSLIDRSGYAVLEEAGIIKTIPPSGVTIGARGLRLFGFGQGQTPAAPQGKHTLVAVAVAHIPIWYRRNIYKDRLVSSAEAMAKRLRWFDLIITGDNHQTFHLEEDEKQNTPTLVNAGSFMRMASDQVDHQPCVFLINLLPSGHIANVKKQTIPVESGVVSREHLVEIEARDGRITVFAESLNRDVEVGLSFRSNLEAFVRSNKVHKDTEALLWQSLSPSG